LYTPSVVNAPGRIDMEVRNARETLRLISAEPIRAEARQVLDGMRLRDDQWRKEKAEDRTYCGPKFPPFQPTYYQVVQQFETRKSGRRGDIVKVLWFDGDGLCLLSKRLERGRFVWPQASSGTVSLSGAQLSMLLEGIDWRAPLRTAERVMSV
jgi:hypothetical protein